LHPSRERFCQDCGVPLIYAEGTAGAEARTLDDVQQRARKIRPQYAEGELIKVVGARNLTEADFIQGLLLEEGVPSLQRRARGFDVPDFLAAGPRDVLVPASGVQAAREVLLQSELISATPQARAGMDKAWKVLACMLAALAVLAILVWLGR
jgi:hypothetical protein